MSSDRTAWYRYRRMMPYIGREWRRISVIAVLTVVAAGVSALMPWPMKLLVDFALGDQQLPAGVNGLFSFLGSEPNTTNLIISAGLASFGLYIINSALSWGQTWNWSVSGYRMLYDLAGDIFARLQRLSFLYHGERPVGDLLSRISTDSFCVYKLASDLLITPMGDFLKILTICFVAWALDPLLSLLMLSVVPLLALSARYFGGRLKRRSRLQREAESKLTSFVHQSLSSVPIIKTFTREEHNKKQFEILGTDVVRRAQKGNLATQKFSFVNESATATGTVLIVLMGGYRVLEGEITLGSLLVFIAYAKTLLSSFKSLVTTYGKVKGTEASIDRVLDVLDAEHEIKDRKDAQDVRPKPSQKGIALTFDEVCFGYEPHRPVLEHLNLEIQPGETLALVGTTGAGKTTLASLVLRFFDPWSGVVRFDDIDVRDIRLKSLRRQVALVLQDPFILPLTVAENIAYGRQGASLEEIKAASVAANADEFIGHLPDGYETVIGERGATLSGGQRQRLAIARALLKNAPILILDEPTSALDAGSETLILEALERLMQDRTTLIIAHRLSTIRNADRIAVLQDGRIVEQGTEAELIGARRHYWAFHVHQFGQPHLRTET